MSAARLRCLERVQALESRLAQALAAHHHQEADWFRACLARAKLQLDATPS